MKPNISVFGAGSWGTALALLAARNGCQTLIWGHNPEHLQLLAETRENHRYLPGFTFPDTLQVAANLQHAATFSPLLLITVPSHAFQETLLKLKPYVHKNTRIVWATKGFNPEDGALLDQVVSQVLSPDVPMAILSGPSFAVEVASNLPTAITIASTNIAFAEQLAGYFHNPRFRAYTSADIIGVQVGGAVKNVLAIAAGIADGLGFGANTRAALITRGLNEIMRLGLKLGGKQETFMGLAGLGDLILTCTDNQSRNRRYGIALGQGKDRASTVQEIGQEIEGIFAAKETYLLAQKLGIDMPITEQTYKVLYENTSPLEAVQNLLNRDQKPEAVGL
ncbi:MAG: NAD(P)-dependent glycerol-3-phosphate dehydrogenase [Methylococcaceae bacterium]|nr:NAD(P)-dependent glycerol-3-phosphate dehydrogenase [Methylococcaceae bacterium]